VVPEVIPLIHYGKGVYAVESVISWKCPSPDCNEDSHSWASISRLSDLGDEHPERPLYGKINESTRRWEKVEPPPLAQALLDATTQAEAKEACRFIMVNTAHKALPALLAVLQRPYTQGWRGTLLWHVWSLCADPDNEGARDERGCLVVKGHWGLLTDLVCEDTWEAAHHAAQVLALVGLPRVLRDKVAISKHQDIAQGLLSVTEPEDD
jgi:hypothetical protein